MPNSRSSGPKVPVIRPDPEAASRSPGKGAQDRPGFDLGGAKGRSGAGKMKNPKGTAAGGADGIGRAGGFSDPGGSRPLGNRSGPGSAAGSGATKGSPRRG